MEAVNTVTSDSMLNETEWSEFITSSFINTCETSDASIPTQNNLKVKVEIELKEENGLVYEPDFYGRLRLVSLNQNVPSDISAVKNKQSDILEWHYIQHPSSSEIKESVNQNHVFINRYDHEEQSNGISDFSEKTEALTTNGLQNTVSRSSHLCNFTSEDTQFPRSNQINQTHKHRQKKKELSYILAEKKRNYRIRIKEENPSMWCAMKQKDACKKREQREEKRQILFEMQRMMELSSLPDFPNTEYHKSYLEALKERYPEVWHQLEDALSAAEQRNLEASDEKNTKRGLTKPLQMYKDVVEAQKKYLYRQRMKLERPDLYEKQKARDSYARSIKRMLKKKVSETHCK